MPLLRVKRHMGAISSRQAWRVWPSWTSDGVTAILSSAMAPSDRGMRFGVFSEILRESGLLAPATGYGGASERAGRGCLIGRIELFPAGEEVMIDQPDDVEAIGDNAGAGEVSYAPARGKRCHLCPTTPA